jgi:3-oxoacyl-[acyl-carrier protein] reductase
MRNILIIGGSSSIGDSVEQAFMGHGDNVLSTYFSNPGKKENTNIKYIKLDLCAPISYLPLLDEVANNALDALIILSGVLPGQSIDDYLESEINEVVDLNFTSNIHIIKALLPHLKMNSNVILMSSISAIRGSFDPVYAASKAAQIGLVRSLALWNKDKYKINAIAPSLIDKSSMYFDMSAQRRAFHKANSSAKKLVTKSDIAKLIFDLCEPDSKYVNGEIIEINGSAA